MRLILFPQPKAREAYPLSAFAKGFGLRRKLHGKGRFYLMTERREAMKSQECKFKVVQKTNKSYSILKFDDSMKTTWDNHVRNCKNTHFFFLRNYIEYHQEKYDEHSLMIWQGKKVIGILPGNIEGSTFISHQGLTFGGLLVSDKARTTNTGEIIEEVLKYLKDIGITNLIYKKMPYIYNSLPFDEDTYHLINKGGKVHSAEIGQVIDYRNYKLSSTRKNEISRAESHDITIQEHDDYTEFWNILEYNLSKHGASPTHSLEEISYLASQFPNNIRFFCAQKENQLLCGTALFVNKNTVHTQYIGSTEGAHQYFALEFLLHEMIEKFKHKNYFSFGTSTKEKGKFLNDGLAFFKEGFGARGVLNITYTIDLK